MISSQMPRRDSETDKSPGKIAQSDSCGHRRHEKPFLEGRQAGRRSNDFRGTRGRARDRHV